MRQQERFIWSIYVIFLPWHNNILSWRSNKKEKELSKVNGMEKWMLKRGNKWFYSLDKEPNLRDIEACSISSMIQPWRSNKKEKELNKVSGMEKWMLNRGNTWFYNLDEESETSRHRAWRQWEWWSRGAVTVQDWLFFLCAYLGIR